MILRKGDPQNDSVKKLQMGLAYLGFDSGGADGRFGERTEDAVIDFQEARDLYMDGVAGNDTIGAYNEALTDIEKIRQQTIPEIRRAIIDLASEGEALHEEQSERLKWVKCPADKFEERDGYTSTRLRADTAEQYNLLFDAAHELGGIITSAGGKRALASKAGKNRSQKSFHYTGRAFDMALPTGLQNPAKDPFIIVRDGDTRYWNVWCVSTLPMTELAVRCGAKGIAGGKVELEGTYISGKKVLTKSVWVVAFNFTQLAKHYGFGRIPARKSFFGSKPKMGAAEWWHFQWETGLIKGQTTFGQEILKVYTLAQAEQFIYWNTSKDCRWGVNWG